MSKTCLKHECRQKGFCQKKIWLGYLALCRLKRSRCPFFVPNPYGRYEPEDVLIPDYPLGCP